MKKMIRITKQERDALDSVGLLRYRKQYGNRVVQDSNLVVANKDHIGKNSKTYYIVEEPTIMKFLGYYDNLNLQRINNEQFNLLVEKGLIDDSKIQHWGEYNPRAVCYENQFGERRISKISSLMLALGLWKTNREKRIIKEEADNLYEAENGESNDFAAMFNRR